MMSVIHNNAQVLGDGQIMSRFGPKKLKLSAPFEFEDSLPTTPTASNSNSISSEEEQVLCIIVIAEYRR